MVTAVFAVERKGIFVFAHGETRLISCTILRQIALIHVNKRITTISDVTLQNICKKIIPINCNILDSNGDFINFGFNFLLYFPRVNEAHVLEVRILDY